MATRTMPNNLEAEESVLGACFLSKYALEKACETLTRDSFYNTNNGKIFEVMKNMLDKKIPVSPDLRHRTTQGRSSLQVLCKDLLLRS